MAKKPKKNVVAVFEKIAKEIRYNKKINPHNEYEEEMRKRTKGYSKKHKSFHQFED